MLFISALAAFGLLDPDLAASSSNRLGSSKFVGSPVKSNNYNGASNRSNNAIQNESSYNAIHSNDKLDETNYSPLNISTITDAVANLNRNNSGGEPGTTYNRNNHRPNTNETYGVSLFEDWPIQPCVIWERSNYLYYQLGYAFIFLAFLSPRTRFGELWQRTFFVLACFSIGVYGYFMKCITDMIIWSGASLLVNSVYLIIALCRLIPVRFEKQFEEIYVSLFQPLHVTRRQFKRILVCMRTVRSLKYQEFYATEKVTKVDSLSLVLSGKLVVSQNHRALHIVFPHQFLDSPEWFGVSTDDYFQVSIMAMEDAKVLVWHRDKLRLSIMTDVFLQTVFDHILGRDVVKKLMQVTQVSETIASNGFLPMGCYDDNESKPMLATKKILESNALTALISRQLQTGDINSWRLGRIDETDHETPV